MRRAAALRLFLAAWLVAALGFTLARAGEVVCDDRACLDLVLLRQNLVSGLQDKVEGYAVIVGDLPPAFGGLAQTSSDAPPHGVAMTPQRSSNVASLSKVLTTVALLQALARRRSPSESSLPTARSRSIATPTSGSFASCCRSWRAARTSPRSGMKAKERRKARSFISTL